jgi:hypothetical protein
LALLSYTSFTRKLKTDKLKYPDSYGYGRPVRTL